jgi:putative RecB family exonuclease
MVPQQQSEPITPPPYLSASSISTWKQCRLKYKFSRLDKIPEGTSEALLMGSFVHEILEHLYKRPIEERNLINAKSISSFVWTKSNWEEQVRNILPKDDQVRQFRWNSWWCVENLWVLENPQTITPSGVENEVNGIIGANVPVKGFVDRYSLTDGGAMKISDYKTGKSPRNPAWLKDKWYQLSIYGILLQQQIDKPIEELELLYLKEAVKFTQRPKQKDIDEIIADIEKVYEEILSACQTVDFPTTVTKLCPWCSFKTICPAFNK